MCVEGVDRYVNINIYFVCVCGDGSCEMSKKKCGDE